ncbi:unnamed protein product [Protopolystoma xenopodis]|uniref:Uncharacterized protein n=1 Tax=Protopolystoma xenopodis TaxID=117903 RepID=A0A3S5AFL7_9PLAT|nr:unnamed protein product [Protopolystoma xenopodis]
MPNFVPNQSHKAKNVMLSRMLEHPPSSLGLDGTVDSSDGRSVFFAIQRKQGKRHFFTPSHVSEGYEEEESQSVPCAWASSALIARVWRNRGRECRALRQPHLRQTNEL